MNFSLYISGLHLLLRRPVPVPCPLRLSSSTLAIFLQIGLDLCVLCRSLSRVACLRDPRQPHTLLCRSRMYLSVLAFVLTILFLRTLRSHALGDDGRDQRTPSPLIFKTRNRLLFVELLLRVNTLGGIRNAFHVCLYSICSCMHRFRPLP